MASSWTPNKYLEKPGNGDYVNTWNIPVNGDMTNIDAAFGGVTNLNATAGNATLNNNVASTTNYINMAINVTGSMSSNVVYTIPNGVGGFWIVRNATTDASNVAQTVTFASGSGSNNTVTVLRGRNVTIWSDGTNIYPAEPNIPSIGTVTSVDVSGGTTGLTTSGGPITTNGTITIGGLLAVASGGTGVTTKTGNGSVVLSSNPTFSGLTAQQLGSTGIPSLSTSASNGSLTAGNYYFKIVGVDAFGKQALPSGEASTTTTGNTSKVDISWTALYGAASYQVWFGTTSGGQNKYFSTSNNSYSFTTITGATTATIPNTDTTGFVGIGITTPSNSLEVSSNNTTQIRVSGPNGTNYFDFGRSSTDGFFNWNGNEGKGYSWSINGVQAAQINSNGNFETSNTTAMIGRSNPRVFSNASVNTVTVNVAVYDQYVITALNTALSIPNSTAGTPLNGNKVMFRITDNGVSQNISWTNAGSGSWRAIATTLPTTTTAGKVTYVGAIYNSDDAKWDVVAVGTET